MSHLGDVQGLDLVLESSEESGSSWEVEYFLSQEREPDSNNEDDIAFSTGGDEGDCFPSLGNTFTLPEPGDCGASCTQGGDPCNDGLCCFGDGLGSFFCDDCPQGECDGDGDCGAGECCGENGMCEECDDDSCDSSSDCSDGEVCCDTGDGSPSCVSADSCGECVFCLLYTSPSPRDRTRSRMPSSA